MRSRFLVRRAVVLAVISAMRGANSLAAAISVSVTAKLVAIIAVSILPLSR